jgi:hypothetical protein
MVSLVGAILLPREAMSRAKGAGSCWRLQKLGTGLFGGCAGCAGNSGVGVGLLRLVGYYELKTPSSALSSSSSPRVGVRALRP